MGFGLLFFGYLIEFILGLNQYAPFIYLLGYAIMFSGICELKKYCRSFSRVQYCIIILSVLSIYLTFDGIGKLFAFSFPFVTNQITNIVEWIDLFAILFFHLFLTLSIRELATKVSLPQIAVFSVRDLAVAVLYYVVFIIYRFTGEVQTMWGLCMIVRLIWSVLYCFLLFSCYRYIAPANEPERVPSRFAFINRLQNAFEKKEQQAIEADRAFHTDNARKRKEKYLNSLSKKARKREEKKKK